MITHQSKFGKVRLLIVAGVMSMLSAASHAQAQYDANCNKRDYTADEMLQQELCSSHVGCKLVMLAEKACKVKDFLGNLGGLLGGRSTPDNLDILEALNRTEVTQTPGVKQTNASARQVYLGTRLPSYDRTNAAQLDFSESLTGSAQGGYNRGNLFRDATGTTKWFEGSGVIYDTGLKQGTGVQIDSKGDIRAGKLLDNEMSGIAVRRSSGGTWAGGQFVDGWLEGPGYTMAPDEKGKGPVMEGTFIKGKADGMMLVTWPDGSSAKQLWKDGNLLKSGPVVGKGIVPTNPKTDEEEAAEKAAAAEAKFAAELNAITSAGGLYTLGDEWAEKGDMEKARKAWRELIRRFPDNSLVPNAADRLSANGASKAAPSGTGSKALFASGQPGDFESCDSSSYFSESMANEDYWLEKTMNAGNGAYGGSRDIYKFMYLKNRAGLAILEKHKACNEPNVYAEQKKYMEDTMNVALQNCMALSSDGGRGCTQE